MTRPYFDLSLCLIVGPGHVDGDPWPVIEAAIAGGVSLVQMRDKTSSTADQIAQAQRLKRKLERLTVPLLVNDRVDVAMEAGADGVHIGQGDMPPEKARNLLGPDKILGLTVKYEDHCKAVDPAIVDYVSIGGVFKTTSKNNPDPPIGISGLRRRVALLDQVAPDLPRCAIAGITISNAENVILAGVDGVCVVRDIVAADDITKAASALSETINHAKGQPRGSSL